MNLHDGYEPEITVWRQERQAYLHAYEANVTQLERRINSHDGVDRNGTLAALRGLQRLCPNPKTMTVEEYPVVRLRPLVGALITGLGEGMCWHVLCRSEA